VVIVQASANDDKASGTFKELLKSAKKWSEG